MNARQSSKLTMLRRVQIFLDRHADIVGSVRTSGARETLDELVVTLTQEGQEQAFHDIQSRSATAKLATLREMLWADHMRPIAMIAKAKLRNAPEFVSLRMPKPQVSGNRLTAHATVMAEVANKYASTFVHAGLPTDFVARLERAAVALRESFDARGQSRSRRNGATAGLGDASSQAVAVVNMLDSLVSPLIRHDPGLLADWQSCRRIGGKIGRMSHAAADSALHISPGSSNPRAA